MKYFVQVENGEARGVVLSEQNLHDLAYSPNQLIGHPVFYELIRSERPFFPFEEYKVVAPSPRYVVKDNYVEEVWDYRLMSNEEIVAANQERKASLLSLVDGLISQATNAMSDELITNAKKSFLQTYINDANLLKQKQDLSFDDVSSIKIDFIQFLKS